MPLGNLNDVLLENLKDLYNAEKQLTRALPRMAKAASATALRDAFEDHLQVTEGQVQRLEDVFNELGVPARGKPCEAMKGLIEEGREVIDERRSSNAEAVDAALIVAAQKIEHYEMAGYGSVRSFAKELGLERVGDLLQQTLDEESEANEKLNSLAEGGINRAAAEEEGAAEEEEEEVETAGRSAARSSGRNGRTRNRARR